MKDQDPKQIKYTLHDKMEDIIKDMDVWNFRIGNKSEFILLDFENPIKTKKHKDTEYFTWKAKVISIDKLDIPMCEHTIEMPSKRVVVPIYLKVMELGWNKEPEIGILISRNKKASNKFPKFQIYLPQNKQESLVKF